MSDMIQVGFRVHRSLVERMDSIIANPPDFLNKAFPRPVSDRTDLIERLVFLASEGQLSSKLAKVVEVPKESKASHRLKGKKARN